MNTIARQKLTHSHIIHSRCSLLVHSEFTPLTPTPTPCGNRGCARLQSHPRSSWRGHGGQLLGPAGFLLSGTHSLLRNATGGLNRSLVMTKV